MSDRVTDTRIKGPMCEWSDLIQGVRTWYHALDLECGVYRDLGNRFIGGVCTYFVPKQCEFDAAAYARHARLVEGFRFTASAQKNRAKYYRESLSFWSAAPALGGKKFAAAIREAAQLDGVRLRKERKSKKHEH